MTSARSFRDSLFTDCQSVIDRLCFFVCFGTIDFILFIFLRVVHCFSFLFLFGVGEQRNRSADAPLLGGRNDASVHRSIERVSGAVFDRSRRWYLRLLVHA